MGRKVKVAASSAGPSQDGLCRAEPKIALELKELKLQKLSGRAPEILILRAEASR